MKFRIRLGLLAIAASMVTVFLVCTITAQGTITVNQPAAKPYVKKPDEKVKAPFLEEKTKTKDGERIGPDVEFWEKEYPFKVKSVTLWKKDVNGAQFSYELVFLCTYTQDDKLDKETMKRKVQTPPLKGQLVFFDEEGVVIGPSKESGVFGLPAYFDGALTGVKGDNFRYCVPLMARAIGAKRLVVREK